MDFLSLKDEVEIVLQDSSAGIVDRIPDWINSALALVIDRTDFPGFKSIISVDTVVDQAYTSLPGDCSGRILYVGDGEVEISTLVLEEMLQRYPEMDGEGDVEYVAVEGSLLYYQKIPAAAATLTLLHRRNPAYLELDGDVPEGIPEHLQRNVLVSGAAMLGFDMIEDGIEGNKVNTMAQQRLFNMGLYEVFNWVGKRSKHISRSMWRY